MRKLLPAGLVLVLLALAACGSRARRAAAIGEAYAGPAKLALRQDIPLQSPVVATVRHGDRLDIIQRRRRFMRVRTARGVEGWTEDYLLLRRDEIEALRNVERRALSMPSQGAASTYEALNVHTEPNRYAPSFFQVNQGEKVDVLAHTLTPRTPPQRKPLVPRRPKAAAPERKRKEPVIPLPAPPPLPPNWMELSRTPPEVEQEIAEKEADQPKDDWSLVRNSRGQSGWVLTRRLYMAIPDEVAQYAEGHRITSYFALGQVRDGDATKNIWLWTTIGGGDHPYDFDNFRVFTWSLRRHRYETAYIQRNVQGYFPVLAQPSGFSLCLDNADGARMRRSYSFNGNAVRFTGQQPCEASAVPLPGEQAADTPAPLPAPKPSLYARLKALAKKWFSR